MNVDDFERLEDIIFNICSEEIAAATEFIHNLLVDEIISFKDLLYLILFSLRTHPQNVFTIRLLLQRLNYGNIDKIQLLVDKNDSYLKFFEEFIPQLEFNNCSNFCFNPSYFPLMEVPYSYIIQDNEKEFEEFVSQSNWLDLDIKILEFIALCGSKKCFDVVSEFIRDELITENIHIFANKGGCQDIIEFFINRNQETYNKTMYRSSD